MERQEIEKFLDKTVRITYNARNGENKINGIPIFMATRELIFLVLDDEQDLELHIPIENIKKITELNYL